MKNFRFLIIVLLFSLMGCTTTTSSVIQSPTTTSPVTESLTTTTPSHTTQALPPTASELRDRIRSMYENQGDSAVIKIDTDLEVVVHFDNMGLDVCSLVAQESDVFDPQNRYFFGSYSDNHSTESWLLVNRTPEGDLNQQKNDNGHLTFSSYEDSAEGWMEASYDPYHYFDFFFSETDYAKENADVYSLTLPFSEAEGVFDLSVHAWSSSFHDLAEMENATISIRFQFYESSLEAGIRIYIPVGDSLANAMNVNWTSTLIFPESLVPFSYIAKDFFLDSSDSIGSATQVYQLGETIFVFSDSNRLNVVKMNLEPGYYRIGPDVFSGSSMTPYILDEQGNRIDRTSFYAIQQAGEYYYCWEDGESVKRTIPIFRVPTEEVGTIDSPILSGPVLSGSTTGELETNGRYFLLSADSPGAIIKLTGQSLSGPGVLVSSKSVSYGVDLDSPTYIAFRSGEPLLLYVYGYSACTYEITWEIIPGDAYTDNLSEMKIIPVLEEDPLIYAQGTIAVFGNEAATLKLKFEIVTPGMYALEGDFITKTCAEEEDCHYLPESEVYTADGQLFPYAGLGLMTYYEAGIYYLSLRWYEGEYGVFSACVIHRSEMP